MRAREGLVVGTVLVRGACSHAACRPWEWLGGGSTLCGACVCWWSGAAGRLWPVPCCQLTSPCRPTLCTGWVHVLGPDVMKTLSRRPQRVVADAASQSCTGSEAAATTCTLMVLRQEHTHCTVPPNISCHMPGLNSIHSTHRQGELVPEKAVQSCSPRPVWAGARRARACHVSSAGRALTPEAAPPAGSARTPAGTAHPRTSATAASPPPRSACAALGPWPAHQ